MSGRKSDYEEKQLADLLDKYQDLGIVVWGEIEGVPGTYAKILVKSDGTVKVEGIITISGTVDVSDRAARLLGRVYGSQGQQLLQRALTYESIVQLSHQGTEYDARQIRALTSSDVVDISDKAARLLGIIYGNVGQLQQRAVSGDAYVQLRTAGAEYDARQIRALIATDVLGVVDALGNRMPSMDAIGRRGYVAITDGAETLSIDASNRAETAPVQATRANLTVKGERDDTSLAYATFAVGVASDVAVLAAGGAGIKHKIYACGYTIDAAVQAGFRFNSANPRFCVRRTAGVFAQSFPMPVVSAANVTLTLRVEGACNGDYWVQYVSEA